MRSIVPLLATALLAVPALALAQSAGADQPGASAAAPPTSSAAPASPAETGGRAPIAPGLPVKDKTGATIGSVTDVTTDSQGNQIASVKMGADQFGVDTSALAVDNGAAVINATQAEIRSKLANTR